MGYSEQGKVMTRKSHSKSRRGCEQCKCDENRPLCRGCVKRELPCRYNESPLPTGSAAPKTSPSTSSQPPCAIELQLMHHFAVWTYKTCDNTIVAPGWWQQELPVLATQHDHLLYALLSFTSLHVAHLHPEEAERYVNLAVGYQDRTLKILPTLLNDISSERASACFWSSAMVGLVNLAMSNTSIGRQSSAKHCLLELSTLWKGAEMVGEMCTAVTGMAYHGDKANTPPHAATPTKMQDLEFSSILGRARDCVTIELTSSAELRDKYIEAIDDLSTACSAFEAHGTYSGIISWFPCLDAHILDALTAGQADASFVIVFYGVALHTIKELWYVQDLGSRLVEELTPAIPLKHKEMTVLVNWARERVCS